MAPRAFGARSCPKNTWSAPSRIAMAIRDGADHVFLGQDRAPNALGAIVQYRVADALHTLIPPPFAHVRPVAEALRSWTTRSVGASNHDWWCGWFEVRLIGHLVPIWAAVRMIEPVAQITLGVPLRPDLSGEAAQILDGFTDANGMVEFLNLEFE